MLVKTTIENRELVSGADLNFETVENKALRNYFPKYLPFVHSLRIFEAVSNAENVRFSIAIKERL